MTIFPKLLEFSLDNLTVFCFAIFEFSLKSALVTTVLREISSEKQNNKNELFIFNSNIVKKYIL